VFVLLQTSPSTRTATGRPDRVGPTTTSGVFFALIRMLTAQ